ncbi:MAG: sulfatase [Planctomycetaceae bacterium]|nr:sulfatase [Planctomycetaceae bacterium]
MKNLVIAFLSILPTVTEAAQRPNAQRPNIVFMLSDDQNWSGLSVAMHPDIPNSKSDVIDTPNLEKLARQGMRFSAAYAPASVCSPTRISLQTGKSPGALHWTKASGSVTAADGYKMIGPRNIRAISRQATTIGELLNEAGYATAHYGKWHINAGGPGAHGYDEGDGDIGNEYAHRFGDPNPADIFGMAKRAAAFMEKHARADKPFFVQMSWHALHAPQNAMKTTLAKYQKRIGGGNEKRIGSAAIAENLDTGVGMVMQAIDRLGLAENTFVIFMSDNGAGGGGRRSALSGGKGSVWEGGIRVPLIVRGPGVTPNSWCHTRVVGYDFFPTYCEWASISRDKLPGGIEGGSIASLLANNGKGQVKRPRAELVFHFPHYQSADGPHSALLLGDLKLMKFYETGRLALFDLSKDVGERNDLSGSMPSRVKELDAMLVSYLRDVDAQLPTVNANYDPSQPPPVRKRGGGGRNKTRRGGKRAQRGEKS